MTFKPSKSMLTLSASSLMLFPSFNALAQESAQESMRMYAGAEFWPAAKNPVGHDAEMEARITAIIAAMSLEEKVGQVIQSEIKTTTPADVKKYHLGSVLNGGGSMPNGNKHATPREWLELADAYYAASMDTADGKQAIPIIWGSDAVHGHNNVIGATIFPHNIGLGAANNPALMRQIGEVTAREVRVTGIDWTFAPTLAVAQNDRWGRTYESYSEDPAIVKAYAREMVIGLQGEPGTDEFLDVNHVVATAKHFLGDGGTEDGDDQGNTAVPESELRDIHGAAYVSALESGVQTVMASFSSWNGKKMHGHKYLLTDVLKDRMGLDGLLVGDWNGHGQLPGCSNEDCALALNAGLDLFMVPDDWKQLYRNTIRQVERGNIPMERLDDAVRRILRVKFRAGLFSKGRPSDRGLAGRDGIIGSDEHRLVARQAVRESLVLLKNNNSILPIRPDQTILVAGDGADNLEKQTGGWTITWQGTGNRKSDFPGATSIFDGLKLAMEDGRAVLSADGKYANKPDVAVVVFGEDPYAEGQGDRDSIVFEPQDKKALRLLQKFKADGIPVVSVFLSGRPMWVNPELNASDAFVAAWLPGSEGAGIADVLVGDEEGKPRYDFKGRLSFSWPKAVDQDKLNRHHLGYAPLFELGYGLSYAAGSENMPALPEAYDPKSLATAELPLFDGGPRASLFMMLSNASGKVNAAGARTQTEDGMLTITTIDKRVQEDARRIVWTGGVPSSLTLNSQQHMDLSAYKDGMLSFSLKVNEAPTGQIMLGTMCEQNCGSLLDLTRLMQSDAYRDWGVVTVDMKCLANGGLDLKKVTTPFMLVSSHKADIAVADIVIHRESKDSMLACE